MMFFVSDVALPWQQLFETSPTAISVIDPFGRQVACNQAYADLLGYPIDELADLDVGRVTRSSDHLWTRSYLRQLASGDVEEFVTDKVYVRKDGSEFTARLSARALRDIDGQCSLLAATIVPVEERAPIGEASTRRLLEFTTDSLTIIDPNGEVRETTGRYAPVLGYPPEFWHTRTIFDLVSDDERSRLVAMREQLIAEPTTPIETEIEVRAADGSIETLQVLATNCLDDPEIGGIVVTTRNITEHLRTLSELLRSRDVAEEVADAQTRLLATVSHELRNPLHAVQGLAELLADEDLPAPTAALAETLRRQLSSLTQVTQDLLDAARLDAGAVAIEPRPTNVAALVSDVVAVGASAAADKPVDVSSRLAVDVPDWVMIDGDRVRQVLTNLVGNAVKFTSAGSVQLVVRASADDTINFVVVDTGVGIPAEEQAAVLEPFRVASTGGDNRGAGLGLSIVQRLVKAMNGRIRMSSEAGRGTRFELWLPVQIAAAPGSIDGAELPAGLHVLVVEDNPVNQQLARSQLERLGLVATVVAAGEEALDLLAATTGGSFDVVLMDHQLPGISGIETTRRIRERSDGVGGIPVVGLSASASTADADAFFAAGMNDFVAKPASLGALATAIARVVDGASTTTPEPVAAENPATDAAHLDLDLGVLAELAVDLGDHDIVAGLVETFLDELDSRVDAIDAAARGGDVDTARRAAHTLKSSARLLGAVQLADACAAIERDPAAPADVVALAAAARSHMQGWLDRPTAPDREGGS